MNQTYKNRIIIISLFALTVIPFSFAWYLSADVGWLNAKTNKGKLITPVILSAYDDFIAYDDFSKENKSEIKGRWLLLNVIPSESCLDECKKNIVKTKQLRLMMGKDLTRIRRVALLFSSPEESVTRDWWPEDLRLLKYKASETLSKKISSHMSSISEKGILIIMDPLGNMMMSYDSEFDPYDVKSDLSKLLRISQIG